MTSKLEKLICPDCGASLYKCSSLKLVIYQGELTVNCPLCNVVGIPVDLKDGRIVNRKREKEEQI